MNKQPAAWLMCPVSKEYCQDQRCRFWSDGECLIASLLKAAVDVLNRKPSTKK